MVGSTGLFADLCKKARFFQGKQLTLIEAYGMPVRQNVEILGDNLLLLRVPKSAIISYLIENVDPESLQFAFSSVAYGDVSQATLSTLSHSGVVRVFQSCDHIPDGTARQLHEEYRYRGMKSLYLYEYEGAVDIAQLSIVGLNQVISELQQDLSGSSSNYSFSEIQARAIEPLDAPHNSLYEIFYSYVAPVHITEPTTECPRIVNDLRYGFIWLHLTNLWLAICAKDDKINHMLSHTLEIHTGITKRHVVISKSILQRLESIEQVRRATLYDPSTGTRRRWTNPDMVRDPAAMSELQSRDAHDERPASGYNEVLPDGTSFALGYSNDKGKMFFSRDLTVSQIRDWCPRKITQIVNATRELCVSNPNEYIQNFAIEVLSGCPAQSKDAIVKISQAIVVCKTQGLSETPVTDNSLVYFNALGNKVDSFLRVNCEICQEPSEVRCTNTACQSLSVKIINNQLVCSDCRSTLNIEQIECSEGHTNIINSPADVVHVIPKYSLLDPISRLLSTSSNLTFNPDEEFFYIRGNRLFFCCSNNIKHVYLLEEVPEFARLLTNDVPPDQVTTIRNSLKNFKEKCGRPSIVNCGNCVEQRISNSCYLRLFGLFDPQYQLTPHQGHEYGDYSKLVTLENGQQKQMVLLMKKANPSCKPISIRNGIGRDIYSQVALYLNDSSVDVIGICVPGSLAQDFKAFLKLQGRWSGKKFMFLSADELIRIIYNTLVSKNITLAEI